jgi:hypothetical protein
MCFVNGICDPDTGDNAVSDSPYRVPRDWQLPILLSCYVLICQPGQPTGRVQR